MRARTGNSMARMALPGPSGRNPSGVAGRAWVHYNANERHVALIGEGLPIPQQDNYLTRVQP